MIALNTESMAQEKGLYQVHKHDRMGMRMVSRRLVVAIIPSVSTPSSPDPGISEQLLATIGIPSTIEYRAEGSPSRVFSRVLERGALFSRHWRVIREQEPN